MYCRVRTQHVLMLVLGGPRSYRPPRRSRIPFLQYVLITTFHASCSNASITDFSDQPNSRSKIPPDTSAPFTNGQNATPSKRFLWTLSFYAQFFDVDTSEVLRRCTSSLYPRAPFLDILDGNPDLYGPFWIATTLVFILFVTATMSQYRQYLSEKDVAHFEYNFTLLSGAAGLIYGYTGFVPVALWGLLRWFGAESATLVECWALYGYANVIWIPVALISWSPITILNYVFVGIGFALSAVFLVRNLWPVVSVTEAKVSRVLVIGVVALHAGLAIAIKFTFFAWVHLLSPLHVNMLTGTVDREARL